MVRSVLVALLAASACNSSDGSECTDNGYCASGTVCEAGVCRAVCRHDIFTRTFTYVPMVSP
jgi:hypothetical protein